MNTAHPSPPPPFTAILLAYRHSATIVEAINGLLAQTLLPAEIIISDDGSDDNTFELAERHLSARLPSLPATTKITLRRNAHNLGLIKHLDLLVTLATQPLIVIFAGDDISIPRRIELTHTAWQSSGHPERCVIHGNVETLDETPGRVLCPPVINLELTFRQIAFASALHIGATEAFSRDLWVGWPPVTELGVFEDVVLGFRAALAGHYLYLNETLVRYQLHGGLGDPSRRVPARDRLNALQALMRQRKRDLDHLLATPNCQGADDFRDLRQALVQTLQSPMLAPAQAAGADFPRLRLAAPKLPQLPTTPRRPKLSVIVPLSADSSGYLELLVPMLRLQRLSSIEWIFIRDAFSPQDDTIQQGLLPERARLFALKKMRGTTACLEAGLRLATGEWLTILPPATTLAQDALRTLVGHAENTQSAWATVRPTIILGGCFGQDLSPSRCDACNELPFAFHIFRRHLTDHRPQWWRYPESASFLTRWKSNLLNQPVERHSYLDVRLAALLAGPLPHPGLLHDLLQPYSRRTVPITNSLGEPDTLFEAPTYHEWLAETYLLRTESMAAQPLAQTRAWAIVLDARNTSASELAHSLASLIWQTNHIGACFILLDEKIASPVAHDLANVNCFPDEEALCAASLNFAERLDNVWWIFLKGGDLLSPDALSELNTCLDQVPHESSQLIYFDHDEVGPDSELHSPNFKPAANPALLRSTFYLGRALGVSQTWLSALNIVPGPLAQHTLYRLALRTFETEAAHLVTHRPGVLAHLNDRFPSVIPLDPEDWRALGAELVEHANRCSFDAEIAQGPVPGSFHFRPQLTRTPRISILIPTKEQLPLLQRCLESLLAKTDYPDFEIIIIDNGSTSPACVEYLSSLERLDPRNLKVLYLPGPFNFSLLNNRAVEYATGEFILLLNNDTAALQPDWLNQMVCHALSDETAAVGARLIFPDCSVQHSGIIVGLRGAADHPFIGDPASAPGYLFRGQLTQNFSAVTAACLLVSKRLYQEIGGLDESVFSVSFNDVDFCLRLAETGKRIIWTPLAVLLHEGSASQRRQVESGDFSTKKMRFTREQVSFLKRWPEKISNDPAYNPMLSLASKGFEIETNIEAIGRPNPSPTLPRVVGLPADRQGCGHYRILQPHQALIDAGLIVGGISHEYLAPQMAVRGNIDSLIFQRPHTDDQLAILEAHAPLTNCLKIFEIDDLIDQIPVASAHHAQLPKDIRGRLERGIKSCDRVVVSTEALANELSNLHSDIRIVPNALPRRLWGDKPPARQSPARRSRPRIGWAGGIGHQADLLLIEEIVRELANEVEWEFFGMCPEPLRPYVQRWSPGVPTEFYPARLMRLAAEWDLAIAPLADNRFNHCKSNLRLLEYGWCGVPVVCSDLTPYRCPLPVTRVSNNSRAWKNAILSHLHDQTAGEAIGKTLQSDAEQSQILIGDRLQSWYKAWTAL